MTTGRPRGNYEVSVRQLPYCQTDESRCRDQTMRHCVFDQVRRGVDVELFHDLGLVEFNGTVGNLQLFGDFFRGQSFGNQLQNLVLPRRQVRSWLNGAVSV